jgi:leucyl aminopeptidase
MKITVLAADRPQADVPLLAVPVAEGDAPLTGAAAALDARLGGLVSTLRARGDFRGKDGETLLLPLADAAAAGAERVLLVGTGKREALTAEKVRRAAAHATRAAARARVATVAFALPADGAVPPAEAGQAAAEGLVLAAYTYTETKSRPEDAPPPVELAEAVLLAPGDAAATEQGARVGAVLARAETLARQLGNLPGNLCTPSYLADVARRVADEGGMRCTVLGPAEMAEEGMGALLGVAAGSAEEPRLIVLEHRGGAEGERPLALVGKGLTFDAGGISIKPAGGMEEMKFDMCGGAAVLGAMQAIAELGLPVNVVGVVPSSENLLGDRAMKPGDVLTSHLGKTIEVVNTDAEGRLILADALSYVRRFEPVAIVDAATLTGACVIALGHHASGVMGNDDALVEELRAAGERSGERAWPLPMYEEYREQIKSDYADLKNTGGRPAGTITAAWFLREFVGDVPWAHLDVAGTAYGDGKLPYQQKGATGNPTRLFVEWVRQRAG